MYANYEEERAKEARQRQATSTGGATPQLRKNFSEAEQIRVADVIAEKIGVSAPTYRDMKLIVKQGTEERQYLKPLKEKTCCDDGTKNCKKKQKNCACSTVVIDGIICYHTYIDKQYPFKYKSKIFYMSRLFCDIFRFSSRKEKSYACTDNEGLRN